MHIGADGPNDQVVIHTDELAPILAPDNSVQSDNLFTHDPLPADEADSHVIVNGALLYPISEEAMSSIYRERHSELLRLARMVVRSAADAEDAVSDAYLSAYMSNGLKDPTKVLAYVRHVVINKAHDINRRNKTREDRQPPDEPIFTGDIPLNDAVIKDEQRIIRRALITLPIRQRQVLFFRYFCDMTEEEIATAMGISRGTIKSHSARAAAALRAILKDQFQ